MNTNITKIPFIVLFFAFSTCLYSQNFGLGVSAIYNLQTEGLGGGIRAEIPFNKFSFVPQIAYYPSFDKITEYYVGASLHFNLFNIKNWTLYTLAHGSYNGWINYESSAIKDAKYANWDAEAGLGLTTSECLRPFIEYRYNAKWKETNFRIGLIYFVNCKKSNNNKNRGRKRGKASTPCPAYE